MVELLSVKAAYKCKKALHKGQAQPNGLVDTLVHAKPTVLRSEWPREGASESSVNI